MALSRDQTWQLRIVVIYGIVGLFFFLFGLLSLDGDAFLPPDILVIVGSAMLLYAMLGLIPYL